VEGAPSKLLTRQSNALLEFCSFLEERPGLAVLDFAPANQATVSFVTNYGHKLYAEDFLDQLDQAFGPGVMEGVSANSIENQSNPLLVSRFFASALNFTDESFDGALVWDSLEHLTPNLAQAAVDKIYRILRPGGYLLAMFHAEPISSSEPCYRYRIHESRNLQMTERPCRPLAQIFNNRHLERLFQDFESVKFFLTRDNLREVIVRK
jgi:SAM-dependent methyltransferase